MIITHYMSEAATADYMIVMDDGKIALSGTPREVFTKVDKVRALGLDVPPMTDLAHSLRQDGVDVRADVLTVDEMVEVSMSIVIEHLQLRIHAGRGRMQTKALDDVSLTIHDGEFVGLIGHTGSGKSTLVQHLNGLILPTSGQITVDGVDLADKNTDKRAIRRRVGLVFQYPENQLFEETVAKDIAFGPKNLGLDEAGIEPVACARRCARCAGLRQAFSALGV